LFSFCFTVFALKTVIFSEYIVEQYYFSPAKPEETTDHDRKMPDRSKSSIRNEKEIRRRKKQRQPPFPPRL